MRPILDKMNSLLVIATCNNGDHYEFIMPGYESDNFDDFFSEGDKPSESLIEFIYPYMDHKWDNHNHHSEEDILNCKIEVKKIKDIPVLPQDLFI